MLINLRVDDLKRKKNNVQKGELDTGSRLAVARVMTRDHPKLFFSLSPFCSLSLLWRA